MKYPLYVYRLALIAFYFVQGVIFSAWASRLPDVKEIFSFNDSELGLLLLAIPLVQITTLPLWGTIVEKLGSDRCLRMSVVFYAGSLAVCGGLTLTQNVWLLVAGLIFLGLGETAHNISLNTQGVMLEKLYGKSIMSLFHGAWSFSGFIAGIVSSFLVNRGVEVWEHFLGVLFVCLAILLALRKYLIPDHTEIEGLSEEPSRENETHALLSPFILLVGVIACVCMACEGVVYDWSSIYFVDVVQSDESLYRLGYTASMGAMAFGRFVGDIFIRKWGRIFMLRVCAVLICSGLSLLVAFPQVVPATLGFLLVGLGVSAIAPICFALAGTAPSVSPSKGLAMVIAISNLGFLLAPPIIGFLSHSLGSLRWALLVMTLVALSILVLPQWLGKFSMKNV